MTFPGTAAYAAVKGAVEVLTVYMAKELGKRGVTVKHNRPGELSRDPDFGGGAVHEQSRINRIALPVWLLLALARAGVPDDIGPMIASLLSGEQSVGRSMRRGSRCRGARGFEGGA